MITYLFDLLEIVEYKEGRIGNDFKPSHPLRHFPLQGLIFINRAISLTLIHQASGVAACPGLCGRL